MRELTAEELSRIKEISLEMLVDFDKFCKENNIEYMISFGTALGAVRHGGFIPWDDDVDVDVHIDDYAKLVKAWFKNGDKEKYFLQTKKTDPYILFPFYRLRKNGTTWTDDGCEKIPIHWGIPIDIFPIYNSSSNPHFFKLQRKIFKKARKCCGCAWKSFDGSRKTRAIKKTSTLFWLWLLKITSDLCKKSNAVYYPYGTGGRCKGKIDDFFPAKPIMFEGVELMGPANPHGYLEWQYGDYMTPPPEDKREGHSVGVLDFENDSEKYTGVLIRNK